MLEEKISSELQRIIDGRTEPWGIHVISVEDSASVGGRNVDAGSGRTGTTGACHPRDSERQVAEKFGAAKTYANNPTALRLRAMNML